MKITLIEFSPRELNFCTLEHILDKQPGNQGDEFQGSGNSGKFPPVSIQILFLSPPSYSDQDQGILPFGLERAVLSVSSLKHVVCFLSSSILSFFCNRYRDVRTLFSGRFF